jgi:hypothetical protein
MPICVAMAISRPFLLALLGAVLLAAAAFAFKNARIGARGDAAPAAQSSQSVAPPVAAAEPAATPLDTLRSALSGKLESAAFDIRLRLSAGADSARVGLSGAFERGAANDVPAVDLHAQVRANGRSVAGGFVTVDEKAYVIRGEDAWQLPTDIWDPVEASALHPENWVRDAKTVGHEQLDGVEATHVSASLDMKAMVRDLGGSGPDGEGRLDAWVGSDGVLRRLSARLAPGSSARGGVDLELKLTAVNEPQTIEAPADVRQGLPGGSLGEFLRGVGAGTDNARKAARAVKSGRKVVLLFLNPRGADDRAVSRSLRTVGRESNALVLTDRVDAVERYGKLVEDLGVSQTPSVVIIDSAGKARLIEGFVDTSSLTQAVADTR